MRVKRPLSLFNAGEKSRKWYPITAVILYSLKCQCVCVMKKRDGRNYDNCISLHTRRARVRAVYIQRQRRPIGGFNVFVRGATTAE